MKKLIFLFFLFAALNTHGQDINHVWTVPISGEWTQVGQSLKVDKNGFVYAVGIYENIVDMNPSPDKNLMLSTTGGFYSDIYVAKYSPEGSLVWAQRISGIRIEKANKLILDQNSNMYIVGNYESTVDFNPNNTTSYRTAQGGQDCFILKLDSNANLLWVNTYGGLGLDRMSDIQFTNDNHIIAIGDFQNIVDFTPNSTPYNLMSAGESDVFILKLDINGNFIWVRQLMGSLYDKGKSIAVDENNDVYALGNFEGTVDFDPDQMITQSLTSFNNMTPQVSITDIFIVKLDAQGNYVWVKQIGGFKDNDASTIIADQQGAVYASGTFEAQNIFNYNLPLKDTFNSTSGFDGFIYSFDLNGSENYLHHFKCPGTAIISRMHLDNQNNLFVTGAFNGMTDFDFSSSNYFLNTTNGLSAFALKLDDKGEFEWAKSIESQVTSAGLDIQTDSEYGIYLTGFWSDTADFDVSEDLYKLKAEGSRAGFITKWHHCFPYKDTLTVTICDQYEFRGNVYSESGYYEALTYDKFNCDSIFLLDLTILRVNASQIETTKENCPSQKNGSIRITNQNPSYTYLLSPGFNEQIDNTFQQLKAQRYQLIVSDSNNCSLTQTISIEKENCCDNPFLPNAFSPNGDGLNDDFGIKYISDFEIKRFNIYNRFGNLVFENTTGWGWDGTYKSAPVETGIYYYLLEYKCNTSNTNYTLKGDIMLLR